MPSIFKSHKPVTNQLDIVQIRMAKIYDGLKEVSPAIQYNKEPITWFIASSYYTDDIVSFNADISGDIYIQSSSILNKIILEITSIGKYKWYENLSDVCKENILKHLESIIEKYKTMPSASTEYCKKVQQVINGEYTSPKEVKRIEPNYDTIILEIADKFIHESNSTLFIQTLDKSLYIAPSYKLFNLLKIGNSYKCKVIDNQIYEVINGED